MTTAKQWKTGAEGQKFVASYSGGKDSTLALYEAMKTGEAIGLISVLEEDGARSRSHGMTIDLVKAQADAIGLPLYPTATSWEDYEATFINTLKKMKELGAQALVTGDLDMPEHGCWHEKVANIAELKLGMPLWEVDHSEVVDRFISLGFKTLITTVNLKFGMLESDLGKVLTYDYVQELKERGIDPCGESGEFHTTVIDGPIFKHPIDIQQGDIIRDGDYAFLPLILK
ncbi:diphthine--ammonia ligase [Metasolibacillus sp.]|uniref:Dph6-related ATP pyrophosphatase n=1 Tax=Metasolibacillus sp. TaxID=2703680 RepID=UPI0025E280B6|nr:diphthine--ammonia ligase [Metasolibacillus sp.]MCT6923722.1 diphthine--ammonia ligase [Metasolibacillus sp.]MCT6940045.1 diphthine--ammonia ligase [Metasolibacillus sp.]